MVLKRVVVCGRPERHLHLTNIFGEEVIPLSFETLRKWVTDLQGKY